MPMTEPPSTERKDDRLWGGQVSSASRTHSLTRVPAFVFVRSSIAALRTRGRSRVGFFAAVASLIRIHRKSKRYNGSIKALLTQSKGRNGGDDPSFLDGSTELRMCTISLKARSYMKLGARSARK